MAKLSDLPERDRNRSLGSTASGGRWGLIGSFASLFVADGACWGAAGMVRVGP